MMIQNYYPTDDDVRAIGDALKTHDQPLTIEAIAQNPWHAVTRDLPHDKDGPQASVELAAAMVQATDALVERTTKWGNRADDPRERAGWHDLAELAQISGESAALAHELMVARANWQKPEFSLATISADPWTAVRLPIPEPAEPELLAHARNWASDLLRHARDGGALAEPMVNAENFTREQNIEAAAERVAALDERIELARAEMPEARAVEFDEEVERMRAARPEPDTAKSKTEQAEEILSRMGDMHSHYDIDPRADGFALVRTFEIEDGVRAEMGLPPERVYGWTKTLEEMQERIIEPGFVPERFEPEESRSHGEFLSGDFIRSRVSEGAARAVDILLGAVIGYFVPEPELTPEQARLVARANAERGEEWDFAMARWDNAAALNWVNGEIDRHRSHVQADEPVRPDSIYERYPGLTRDDNEGRGREAEAERAFYDTGTERSRSRGI